MRQATMIFVAVSLVLASFSATAEDVQQLMQTPEFFFAPEGVETGQEMSALIPPMPTELEILFKLVESVNRPRPVRRDFSVEATVSVIYLNEDGTLFLEEEGKKWKYCAVMLDSMRPLTAGTTFTYSVRRSGADEGDFTFIRSWTVPPHFSGGYVVSKMYLQDGFYDILPNGIRQDWLPGIAAWKADILAPSGERTSVMQEVPVNLDELRVPLGPLQQAVPSSDGKSVLLVSSASAPLTALLYYFFEDGSYKNGPVVVTQNQFIVPDGWNGPRSLVTAMAGYPNAECSTALVDTSIPQ